MSLELWMVAVILIREVLKRYVKGVIEDIEV